MGAERVGSGKSVSPPQRAPREQRVTRLRELVGGEVREQDTLALNVHRVHLTDGRTFIKKTGDKRRDAVPEVLSSQVAEALGLQAPASFIGDDGDLFMEDMPGSVDIARTITLDEAVYDSRDGRLLGLLDTLLNNPDRHSQNILVRDDGGLTAVDHGWAFSDTSTVRTPSGDPVSPEQGTVVASMSPLTRRFVGTRDYPGPNKGDWAEGYFIPNDMSPADMAIVRARLEELRPEFERLGKMNWFNDMMTRLDGLTAQARGTRSLLT